MLKREKRIYKLNNFFIRVNINKKNLKLKKITYWKSNEAMLVYWTNKTMSSKTKPVLIKIIILIFNMIV